MVCNLPVCTDPEGEGVTSSNLQRMMKKWAQNGSKIWRKMRHQKDLRTIEERSTRSKIKEKIGTKCFKMVK